MGPGSTAWILQAPYGNASQWLCESAKIMPPCNHSWRLSWKAESDFLIHPEGFKKKSNTLNQLSCNQQKSGPNDHPTIYFLSANFMAVLWAPWVLNRVQVSWQFSLHDICFNLCALAPFSLLPNIMLQLSVRRNKLYLGRCAYYDDAPSMWSELPSKHFAFPSEILCTFTSWWRSSPVDVSWSRFTILIWGACTAVFTVTIIKLIKEFKVTLNEATQNRHHWQKMVAEYSHVPWWWANEWLHK